MTNIAHEVNEFLDRNPCVRRNMDIKLINTSALAKMIIKEKNLDMAKMDAVISAIRRYKLDYHTPIFDEASELIRKTGSVSIKSGLVCVFLVYELEFNSLLSKLFSVVDFNHKDVLRIIQSDKYLNIVVEAKNLEKITKLFHAKRINKIFRNLAEINIAVDPKVHSTPGIMALLTTELSITSINIIEIIGSYKEIMLYLDEKDMVKAHKVIHNICRM